MCWRFLWGQDGGIATSRRINDAAHQISRLIFTSEANWLKNASMAPVMNFPNLRDIGFQSILSAALPTQMSSGVCPCGLPLVLAIAVGPTAKEG